MLTKVRGYQKR